MKDIRTSFITYYLQSLGERTREEKSGTKYGFDWIIYSLALAQGWTPHRLPFLRSGGDATSKTKTEAEFGVDLSFLSPDAKTLRVFVLKDEVLKNATWAKHSFDIDLRNASAPDLSGDKTASVEQVEVILAYNKDEDATGVKLFDNRVAAMGTHVGDRVGLRFDRWNLTALVGMVEVELLTPSLLPQKFFSHFSYLCAQVADFGHGSEQWSEQTIPSWRRFVDGLLTDKADERSLRLLPVALLVLREFGQSNPTIETAWIDLIEWGAVAAWERARSSDNETYRLAVYQYWTGFYLAELQRYYDKHHAHLAVPLSMDKPHSGGYVDGITSAVVAHWHLGRLGLLGLVCSECLPATTAEEQSKLLETLTTVADWVVAFLLVNPSANRPLIDLHQLELVATWRVLLQARYVAELDNWFRGLVHRLFMRRCGNANIPFIEGRNSLKLVFETVATGVQPPEFCDGSSVYLMCWMELVFSLPDQQRNELLELVYRRLVLGRADCGAPLDGCEPIDLMSWVPTADWPEQVLTGTLANSGECVTFRCGPPGSTEPTDGAEVARSVKALVEQTRRQRASTWPDQLPPSVILLACLKHRSPLPPEFWREAIFPGGDEQENTVATET